MRLIGNKQRLLASIGEFLSVRGVRGGTFIDIFSGTASVGRYFKSQGFRVFANDRMSMCHAKAVAEVEVSVVPTFRGLKDKYSDVFRSKAFHNSFAYQPATLGLADTLGLAEAVHFLGQLAEPREGLIYRNYAPGGGKGRRYFSDENARRIDGALAVLRDGHRQGYLDRAELHLLLSSLLDAADRVANIAGTYGAYLKSWQSNALKPMVCPVPEVLPSAHNNQAFRQDANELIGQIKGDVLYLDPPYNRRQYPANYHVLEILAEHHEIDDLAAYEARLYGKTGLRPYEDLRSEYCVAPSERSRHGDVQQALRDLVLRANVDHVVVSYSEEGLLTREEIGSILARYSGSKSFNYTTDMRSILYKRFCSDSDRGVKEGKGLRSYKVIEGKKRGEISEWLFYATRVKKRTRSGARSNQRRIVPAT